MKEKVLYPDWKVQQAMSIERAPIPNGEEFWITEKLNGVRASFYEGNLIYRSGRVARGLEHITNILKRYPDYFFDGELVLMDPGKLSNNEAFSKAAGILTSYEGAKIEIGYAIFDCFKNGDPSALYSERRKMMDEFPFQSYPFFDFCPVSVVPVFYHGNDISMVGQYLERAIREDEEGVVVNLNRPYIFARHSGVLKVKRFYTVDLPILYCEEGKGRNKGKLGCLVTLYKGNRLGVGTGFTDEERERFWNMRDELPGKICEVRYKTVTYDKVTERKSLQFPVFVRLRDDKTDESYD